MILLFRPFSVDDFINGAGVSGTVIDISILYTVLKTPDGLRIVVPNGQLSNAIVTNYSVEPTRRADIVVHVAYESDLNKAEQTLLAIAHGNEMVLKDPAPAVLTSEYAESSINLTLRVWVESANYWTVLWDINRAIKPALDRADVKIPLPQLDVHVDK